MAAVGAAALVAVLLVAGVVVAAGSDDADDRSERSDRSDDEDDDDDGGDGPVFVPVGPDDPATTDPPEPIAPEGEAVDLSVVQLEAALLTMADVPSYEAQMDPSPQTSDRLTSADMVVTDECRAMLEDHEARGTRPAFGGAPAAAPRHAAQRFAVDGQTTLEHEIADGADVTIDEYRELLTACETIEWGGAAGSSGRLRFTVLDDVDLDLGDDVLHVEYAFNGSASLVRWVLWSRDSIISSVNVSVTGGAGRDSLDRAVPDLEEAAHLADSVLARVIAER